MQCFKCSGEDFFQLFNQKQARDVSIMNYLKGLMVVLEHPSESFGKLEKMNDIQLQGVEKLIYRSSHG